MRQAATSSSKIEQPSSIKEPVPFWHKTAPPSTTKVTVVVRQLTIEAKKRPSLERQTAFRERLPSLVAGKLHPTNTAVEKCR